MAIEYLITGMLYSLVETEIGDAEIDGPAVGSAKKKSERERWGEDEQFAHEKKGRVRELSVTLSGAHRFGQVTFMHGQICITITFLRV